MPSLPIILAATPVVAVLVFLCVSLIYIFIRYSPIVARIFEEKPLFLPLRIQPSGEGEDVWFATRDGLTLGGTYLKSRGSRRNGVLVFCHEYLSDRWSAIPYLDQLRDHGFDLFTFDFRNHGASDKDPNYSPLQWVTKYEVLDLQAALGYLKSRSDADAAGFGFFGVSRGGGTAICVAAREPRVWGVITDGAFPTRGTMVSYIQRWAEIYVQSKWFWKISPLILFDFLAWSGRVRTQLRMGCSYENVERAVSRLAPRPWLAIHGQKDAYIGMAIAEKFFAYARQPKELWVVPLAKHNRCRERDPIAYYNHLVNFLQRSAPRTIANSASLEPMLEQASTPSLLPSSHPLQAAPNRVPEVQEVVSH